MVYSSGYYVQKNKIVLFIGIFLTIGIWIKFYSFPLESIDAPVSSKNKASADPVVNTLATKSNASTIKPGKTLQPSSNQTKQKVLTGNPHYDQLSPGMQKALKDSLLLEGPKKTYSRPDGSVVLPSNGRFTQMPVAVQMPDGTIKIQEYSNIPKPQLKMTSPK